MYQMLRQLLFNFPPESVHHFSMNILKDVNKLPALKNILKKNFSVQHPCLQKNIFGLSFPNPVGLGAGFDKNALYLNELAVLGFGFVEIGTVTPLPQPGNEQPRLFRLPKDKALINRMGFNNNGVKAIRGRLDTWRSNERSEQLVVGGNIGKNKLTPNADAWKDYEACFKELHQSVDYFVVNVSSPNTPGLRELQEKDALYKILFNLQNINSGISQRRPLLLKISPDLSNEQLNDIIELALELKLDGLVATNTTIGRSGLITGDEELQKAGNGGLSGKPLQHISTTAVEYISKQSGGNIPVIASGGIFTGEDAVKKFQAGASLVQVWTGFIYEGPAIAKRICNYLSHHASTIIGAAEHKTN
jgi:dihydroorotate dehydrogenase